MDESKHIEFEDLPSHLLEYIFYYLPLPEIVRLSASSPIFLTIGDNVIRKRFFGLHSGIYKEMKCVKEELDELPTTEDFLNQRAVLYRCYYFLEMLLSEFSLIRAVWRKALYKKGNSTVPIGKLLHEFYSAFYSLKSRSLPPWHINDETEAKIIKYAKLFFECKLNDVQFDRLFGCQILDVLDSMINRQFKINVKYHPENNQCSIDAIYKLRNPHYLNRPPKLNEIGGNVTSLDDKKKILSYFINLVRINNRVTLREEQYHREAEASRSSEMNLLDLEVLLNGGTIWLIKDVRTYDPVFVNPQREERIVNDMYEFEESYRSVEFSHSTSIEKKLICNIQIKCPLDEAPLSIMDCWARLKSDILSQFYVKPHLVFLEEYLDTASGINKESGIEILDFCFIMLDEFQFNNLPHHIKENIFKCLPFSEVSVICTVDLTWLSIGNKVIRSSFFDLCSRTNEELKRCKRELTSLPRTAASLPQRLMILRSYYLLEMLLCELNIIKVIWKNILYKREGNTCSLGFLLDELYDTFILCKQRNLPAWREENEIEGKMLKYTKAFFDHKLKDIDLNKYFGCLIVDFMDLMIDREYTLDVCYAFQRNMCIITGFYKLLNPRYLNRPPLLQNCNSDRPSLTDKKRILQFFINLVRINNRVTLREEQYNKETEFSSRLGSPDQGYFDVEESSIMNDLRDHPVTLAETNHELKRTEGFYDILAAFQTEGFDARTFEKGFSCYFHIICPMKEAPILIVNSWNRIKQKIKNNLFTDNKIASGELKELITSLDSGNISSEEDNHPIQNHPLVSGNTYVFGCTMKSTLLRHDMVETSALVIVEP